MNDGSGTENRSYDVERLLIGAALSRPEDVVDAQQVVDAEDFVESAPRAAFVALCEASGAGERVTVVSLFARIHAAGDAERVGGRGALAEWKEAARMEGGAVYLARLVRREADRRRLKAALAEAAAEAETGDPAETAARLGVALATVRPAGAEVVTIADAARKKLADLSSPQSIGYSLGVPSLDSIIRGVRPGEFFVLGARPYAGKTTLATLAAVNLARARLPVLFVSLEVDGADLGETALCQQSGIESPTLRSEARGAMREPAEAAIGRHLDGLPLFVADRTSGDVDRVLALVRSRRARDGVRAVVVDNLSLLCDRSIGRNGTRVTELASITAKLKRAARELGVLVVGIAHLNRGAAGKEAPTMEDLRDSGSVEQDADVVLLLDDQGEVDVDVRRIGAYVRKRRGGRPGKTSLLFDHRTLRFEADPDPPAETSGRASGPRLAGPRKGTA